MKIGEALEIVHKLAQERHELLDNDGHWRLSVPKEKQEQFALDQAQRLEALNMVEDLIVNEYGED